MGLKDIGFREIVAPAPIILLPVTAMRLDAAPSFGGVVTADAFDAFFNFLPRMDEQTPVPIVPPKSG